MIWSRVRVSSSSGSVMEMLGTRVRLMTVILTRRSTSVTTVNCEMFDSLPMVVGMKTMGGRGLRTMFAPS